MLFDPARHEPLAHAEWNEDAARTLIERIVHDAEERFSPQSHWPVHPLDAVGDDASPSFDLYCGSAGVVWALQYLQDVGRAQLRHRYEEYVAGLGTLNAQWLRARDFSAADLPSYLIGNTGLTLLALALRGDPVDAASLAALVGRNLHHPARELMWGAPGTLLAARFMHERTGDARWQELFVATARTLWSQMRWSPEFECHYWTQELYGGEWTYLDAVHGFVATAAVLIQGRHLLDETEWAGWQERIVATVRNSVQRDGPHANWPAFLYPPGGSTRPQKALMQFCHGAPGFVICLADLPARDLDDDLVAAGEAIWAAGPLRKGSNLCHGTGGNGYAFLKLYARTGEEKWLARARAFAMHGIVQTETHAARYGRMRHSLWTGDPGFAIYLHDCIEGVGRFPTLEVFFAGA